MTTVDDPSEEWDGCSRECRKAGVHTRKWGRCEFAIEPEARVDILRTFLADDGFMSISTESIALRELAERIEKVLRTVPVGGFSPPASTLAGSEYAEMAIAVAMDLADKKEEIPQ